MATKPTVYIETTVVSYLTAKPSRDLIRAGHEILTRKWWEERRHRFTLFTSQIVLAEASAGDAQAAAKRMNELQNLALLQVTPPAIALADSLAHALTLPARVWADAAHVSITAVHQIDYLLTWNCAHLANPALTPKIEKACRDRGYTAPRIVTPELLMEVI